MKTADKEYNVLPSRLLFLLCILAQLRISKFRVVTKPVAHNVSIPLLIANTSLFPTETDLPDDTACPRAINDSPDAGATIFVVKSIVENAQPEGSLVPIAQQAAMSISMPTGPA